MIAIDDRNCRPLRPHAVRLLQATTAAGSRNPSPSASAQCAFLRNAWRGYGELASGPISPALKHFQATAKPPPAFDPQESERLLDAAGLARGRDGTRFHLFHDFVPAGEQYEETAFQIKQALERVGIAVTIPKAGFSFVPQADLCRPRLFVRNQPGEQHVRSYGRCAAPILVEEFQAWIAILQCLPTRYHAIRF
jgi:extracellular solute-binding protein (family 5)